MVTPAERIRSIDKHLAARGQTIKLRRGDKAAPTAIVTIRAFVRGFDPDELVNGITQSDSKVVVSPTSLKNWPDQRLKDGDAAEINGQWRRIEVADPILMQDAIVRWQLKVKG